MYARSRTPSHWLSGHRSPGLRRIRVEPVGPYGRCFPGLVEAEHLGAFPVVAEQVRGVDREQHRLALALVGTKFLALELDEPDIFLAHDQVAHARNRRRERRVGGRRSSVRIRGMISP